MTNDARVTFAQNRLNAARAELRAAVIDFSIPDEKLLEMRANGRAAYEEMRALNSQKLKKSVFAALKFW